MAIPFYFPWADGQYKVTPQLEPLEGNIFAIDETFAEYRQSKLAGRIDRIDKYYQSGDLTENECGQVALTMANRLAMEYPEHFVRRALGSENAFDCKLTNESLRFDRKGTLLRVNSLADGSPKEFDYLDGIDGIDALMMQVQEDMAVWRLRDGEEYLGLIHLFSPNHWPAEAKILKNFAKVHRPVAGMDALMDRGVQFLKGILHESTLQRFAAGLSTDRRLNHHPRPPEGADAKEWRGRDFDPDKPELYLRVERQTFLSVPEQRWALFFIRTYFYDVRDLNIQQKQQVVSAIESMSEAQLKYKGLFRDVSKINEYLCQNG